MEKYKILKSYYQLKKNMLNFKEKIKEEVFMSTPHNQANKGGSKHMKFYCTGKAERLLVISLVYSI